MVEKVVINEVRRLISSPEQIRYVLEKVESEIANLYSDIPDSIRLKEAELRAEEKRLANYINFIGESNTSRTLNEALLENEKKVDALQAEIDGMRQMRDKIFQAPSIEWIAERISQFRELLETNTNDSALVLHNLLGPVKLEAKYPYIGKPYYLACTLKNALAITEPSPNCKSTDNGSTSFQWWARKDCSRTLVKLLFQKELR